MDKATFECDGILYTGEVDEQGHGYLWGRRRREPGDARLSGTHSEVVDQIEVENFRAIIHGDKRYDLGEVTVVAS